jgi:transposase-like protein
MPRYSNERKETVLKKLLLPLNMTVSEVVKEENISQKLLYN